MNESHPMQPDSSEPLIGQQSFRRRWLLGFKLLLVSQVLTRPFYFVSKLHDDITQSWPALAASLRYVLTFPRIGHSVLYARPLWALGICPAWVLADTPEALSESELEKAKAIALLPEERALLRELGG